MYVVLAVIVTGVEKVSCCHPLAVPPVNVPVASNVPVADHNEPVCVELSFDRL
jgi:hypothetical protein